MLRNIIKNTKFVFMIVWKSHDNYLPYALQFRMNVDIILSVVYLFPEESNAIFQLVTLIIAHKGSVWV